jgi:drug/metabolite transporter superfamily protein YnfA
MTRADLFRALADVALITHVAFVTFVLGGLLLILLGGFRGWNWIRNPWFRVLHLVGIGLVVVQAWLGVICPLTTLEMALRERAGDSTYGGTFIAHWLQRLIYYEAPPWVFAVCYTVFGLAVVGSWVKFRPRRFGVSSQACEQSDPKKTEA